MIVIIGLPNAGKTTYSKRYNDVLHYDNISHLSKAERNEVYMSTKAECIEGIYNTRESRVNLLSHTKRERNICIWIDTPVDICLERERNNRKRPDAIVLHHARTFEPPALDEGWNEIITIR